MADYYYTNNQWHGIKFKQVINYRVIKAMIKKYPDCLQYQVKHSGTAFLTACGFGHVQLVEELITEHNVDIQGDLT